MPWQTVGHADLQWQKEAQFTREARARIDEERAALTSTAAALIAKGLLTPEEAAHSRPKLLIDIEDQRTDRTVALPTLTFGDPQTQPGRLPLPF